jgi:hypothetical protein
MTALFYSRDALTVLAHSRLVIFIFSFSVVLPTTLCSQKNTYLYYHSLVNFFPFTVSCQLKEVLRQVRACLMESVLLRHPYNLDRFTGYGPCVQASEARERPATYKNFTGTRTRPGENGTSTGSSGGDGSNLYSLRRKP